jgi:hypothetical protein
MSLASLSNPTFFTSYKNCSSLIEQFFLQILILAAPLKRKNLLNITDFQTGYLLSKKDSEALMKF